MLLIFLLVTGWPFFISNINNLDISSNNIVSGICNRWVFFDKRTLLNCRLRNHPSFGWGMKTLTPNYCQSRPDSNHIFRSRKFVQWKFKCSKKTLHPGKINMEPDNWGLEDDLPFSIWWFLGSMLIFRGVNIGWFLSFHVSFVVWDAGLMHDISL